MNVNQDNNEENEDKEDGPMSVIPQQRNNPRLIGELRRLTSFYNPNPMEHGEINMLTNAFCLNIAGFDDGSDVPKSYKDALSSKKWQKWK